MNEHLKHQMFSLEPIYQITNAITRFNERTTELKNYSSTDEKEIKDFLAVDTFSPFFFIQRCWPCLDTNKSPWFQYMYYAINHFASRYEGVLKSLGKRKVKWESLISYVKEHYPFSSTIKKSEDFIYFLRNKTSITPNEINHLHHHLLGLYSHFPVRSYYAETLYNKCILPKQDKGRFLKEAYYVFLPDAHDKNDYRLVTLTNRNEYGGQNDYRIEEGRQETGTDNQLLIETEALSFFIDYLVPLFNEPSYDGDELFPTNNSLIQDMLWLPLYDESGDEFQGYFRGWLFQVLPSTTRRDNEFFTAVNKYAARCLRLLDLVAVEINNAMVNELLDQSGTNIREQKCYEILYQNLHLLGGWKISDLRDPRQEDFDYVYYPKQTVERDSQKKDKGYLKIRLNPKHWQDNPIYTKLNYIEEPEKILCLELDKDFIYPRSNAYYDRQVSYIYKAYIRLLQQQAQKNVESENQISRWAHALRTRLTSVRYLLESREMELAQKSLGFLSETIHALTEFPEIASITKETSWSEYCEEYKLIPDHKNFQTIEDFFGKSIHAVVSKIAEATDKYGTFDRRFQVSQEDFEKLKTISLIDITSNNFDDVIRILGKCGIEVSILKSNINCTYKPLYSWSSPNREVHIGIFILFVLDELLSNAIKHAQKTINQSAKVKIEFILSGKFDKAECKVNVTNVSTEVNGLKENSRQRSSGSGMAFCKQIAKAINVGEYIEAHPKGTEQVVASFVFPVIYEE